MAKMLKKSLTINSLLQLLHQKGFFQLNQIDEPNSTNLWNQGWKGSQALEIPEPWTRVWDHFIIALHSSHIRLTDKAHELIWEHAQNGHYTPKTGYQQICSQHFQQDHK